MRIYEHTTYSGRDGQSGPGPYTDSGVLLLVGDDQKVEVEIEFELTGITRSGPDDRPYPSRVSAVLTHDDKEVEIFLPNDGRWWDRPSLGEDLWAWALEGKPMRWL